MIMREVVLMLHARLHVGTSWHDSLQAAAEPRPVPVYCLRYNMPGHALPANIVSTK
jgi:hypothetical protein